MNREAVFCPKCKIVGWISELAPTSIGSEWRCVHCGQLSSATEWKPSQGKVSMTQKGALQLLVEVAEDLVTQQGNCQECGWSVKSPSTHHPNCPVGRLFRDDIWKQLVACRQGLISVIHPPAQETELRLHLDQPYSPKGPVEQGPPPQGGTAVRRLADHD